MSIYKIIRGFIAPIFFIVPIFLQADFIIVNDSIVDDRAIGKMNELGSELKAKTGINVYISAQVSLNGKKIKDYESEVASTLPTPYVILAFSRNDTKVDILSSKEVEDLFDKEQILSPYPWSGTIIPFLSMHGKDLKAQESAALLNGYADIVEQIAASKDIVLEGAIGNQNQYFYYIIKVIFYGTIFVSLGMWLYYKIQKRRVVK